MTALSRALSPFALFFLLAIAPASAQNFDAMPTSQLKANITDLHPAGYYVLASRLFDAGERDEAVFWFYAGQLRYRVHLACTPDTQPDSDAALFGALSEVIGSDINAYAFGDVDTLTQIIDSVIAWDESAPDGFAAGRDCSAARTTVLAGLRDLQSFVVENADEVRAERAASGMANR